MKLSYNWLKEFVKINVSPNQLAGDLNSFGHEVEEVKQVGNDWILDLSITANRGDCLSVLGMAREISALYNFTAYAPPPRWLRLLADDSSEVKEVVRKSCNLKLKINVFNPQICPRYSARIIDDIQVKDSPSWMQNRLKSVGIRPINNIVDITNYVMLQTGQPLHAFDFDKIHDRRMNIRLAKTGESVITLDGKKRELDENSIIIEDGEKIYDLAGIMGGANSEVDKNTKTIVLQAAIFDKKLIRFTSKRLKHITDASYRYERGVDYNDTISALETAAYFTLKDCPLGKMSEIIDIQSKEWQPTIVAWNPQRDVKRLLGVDISYNKIMEYLQRLGISCIECSLDKKNCQMQSPSWRHDLVITEDLVEEVARIHGYNKIEKKLPKKNQRQSALKSASIRDQYILKEFLKNILVENGFTEVYSYSFADKKLMQLLGIDLAKCRRVVNSVAPELEYLRNDLRPSILSAIAKNPWAPEINIFEIGKVFRLCEHLGGGHQDSCEVCKGEIWQLAIATVGKSDQLIQKTFEQLDIKNTSEVIESFPQNVLDHLKIRRPVKYVILDLNENVLGKIPLQSVLSVNKISGREYKSISQFPPTIRDLAFIVDKKINAKQIRSHLTILDSHILLVELFDEFQFPSATSMTENQCNLRNKKNLAYHLWLQDIQKPMDPKEVEKIIEKIIKEIESKFNAKLRQ